MRLIDADTLNVDIALIAKKKARSDAQKALMGRLIFVVENYPTIEAEPVKHGWWETGTFYHRCTACGAEFVDQTPYCPNCGAKMVGGADNER